MQEKQVAIAVMLEEEQQEKICFEEQVETLEKNLIELKAANVLLNKTTSTIDKEINKLNDLKR